MNRESFANDEEARLCYQANKDRILEAWREERQPGRRTLVLVALGRARQDRAS